MLDIENTRGHVCSNYFLKANDYWEEWAPSMKVYKHIEINKSLSVVPVSFLQNHLLMVFVANEKGRLRIIKVEDADYWSCH